jgi:1-acyl-sn-glycerol-3-phosphate acyltransferase
MVGRVRPDEAMLDFSDARYQFFPPRPSRAFMAVCRTVNRLALLPGPRHRVTSVEVRGDPAAVEALRGRGARLLFIANHPTHNDPQVLTEVQRRLGTPSLYLAAYDVFLRSRFVAWVMQRNGAFSIDRDGADRKAMAAAVESLQQGRFALSIFPEGNVFFNNDRVSGFLPGAAFIALKAQKALGPGNAVHVVPVSLKYTHLTDVRPQFMEALGALAAAAGTAIDPAEPPQAELMRVGLALLARNLRQRGHRPDRSPAEGTSLFDTLRDSAERIIAGLEHKMELAPKPSDTLPARLAKIRSGIHQVLTDPAREIDHRAARSWSDEAILALRILGYESPYVSSNPTLDRFAETVEKLREDLYSKPCAPFGPRKALVHVGSPIDLGRRTTDGAPKLSPAELTRELEAAVQAGVEAVNADNRSEGARPV